MQYTHYQVDMLQNTSGDILIESESIATGNK